MVTAKDIEPRNLRKAIKKCPKEIQEYISALESSNKRYSGALRDAIAKIKELSDSSRMLK